MITRRGFLKVGTSLLGGVALSRYTEIAARIHPYKDWIMDDGDYYIVRIPDYKIMSRESFDKPVLLLNGYRSMFMECHVNGFLNVGAGDESIIDGCLIDASKCVSVIDRHVVTFNGKITGMTMQHCILRAHTCAPIQPLTRPVL